jgi:hypothetical protein
VIARVVIDRQVIVRVVTGPQAKDPSAGTVLIAESDVHLPDPVAEGEKAEAEQAASISGAKKFASSAPKK